MALINEKEDGSVETSFEGCVVATSDREVRVMSDVYAIVSFAIVFDIATGTFSEIQVKAHFELDTRRVHAVVDASEDIKSIYATQEHIKEVESQLASLKRSMATQIEAVKAPVRGRTIKVVKGRKVPVGTVGSCFWTGPDNYGGIRVGLKTPTGETFFTAATNCEAVIG